MSIDWAESSNSLRRAKNVDIKYYFVKEATADGIGGPANVDSDKNLADGFTKTLMIMKFELFRESIGVKQWKERNYYLQR